MNNQFKASCLCGMIRLNYSGPIGPANYCHCEDCRRTTGSAFNVGVRVERKHLQITALSELKVYKSVGAAGGETQRWFCGNCGSPLFTLHPNKQEFAWIKAGIIHDPDVVKPSYENWASEKVSWAAISVAESHLENRPAAG